MGRIQGLTELYIGNVELLNVKSVAGELFSITIAYNGVTAGDKLVLRDGDDGEASPLVTFTFPDTNGTISREWANGKAFENGLTYDPAVAGTIEAEMTYK